MSGRNERGQFTAGEKAYLEGGDETVLNAELDAAAVEAPKEPDAPPADVVTTPAVTEAPAAAAPAPAAEAAAVDPDAADGAGKVPHQALHRERAEKKEALAELAALRERQAVTEDRMRMLLDAIQKAGKPQEEAADPLGPRPDPNEDVFAAMEWDRKNYDRRIAAVETETAQSKQQQREAAERAQAEQMVWDRWRTDRETFEQATPEFTEAAQWLSDARHKELEAHGRFNPAFRSEAARNAQINEDLKGIVIAAAQQNVSAAEYVYQLALAKGFTPKGPAPTPAATVPPLTAAPDVAAAAAVAAPPPVSVAAAEKLAAMGAVAEASKSLSALPGGTGNDPFSLDALLKMNQRDFSKAVEAMGPDAFRAISGG